MTRIELFSTQSFAVPPLCNAANAKTIMLISLNHNPSWEIPKGWWCLSRRRLYCRPDGQVGYLCFGRCWLEDWRPWIWKKDSPTKRSRIIVLPNHNSKWCSKQLYKTRKFVSQVKFNEGGARACEVLEVVMSKMGKNESTK
jgi:hypothetical protein